MMANPLILIVEDDDATAEFLTDLLSAEGYDTRTLSLPDTLDVVRSARPTLILLDLVFPDRKGEDLLHAVRRDQELSQVPVVLLSAVPHLAERAATLPVQGYVSKPFELDQLLHLVSSLAGRPWMPAQGSSIHLKPGLARNL
jgi:DNA-binding response OmpR family regulator